MDFVPLLVLTALIKKIVDFVKYIAGQDWNAVVTQIVAWAVGIAAVYLLRESDFGEQLTVNGMRFADLNNWSIVLAGVNLASTAGVGWDVIKAVDNTNSAAVPPLLPPPVSTPIPPASTAA